MFKALIGQLNHWGTWFKAGLVLIIIVLAFAYSHRGHQLDLRDISIMALNSKINELMDENAGLAANAQAVLAASQAQSIVCQTEIARRARIEEITEGRPAAKPEDAVDADVSKKAIDLLNHDLFAPLDYGLRQPGG